MKTWLCCAASLLLLNGPDLRTDYAPERTLRIESDTAFSLELSELSMERDGEPVDASFERGGSGSSDARHVVELFKVDERAEGRPAVVLRTFEEARGTTQRSMRGESEELDRESPLEAAVIRVAIEDGERRVEVLEGEGPDDEALLQRFRAELDLDLLLPPPDTASGEGYELEREAIVAALGLDLEGVLFPEPERAPSDADGERGERRGGPRGSSAVAMLAGADWEGQATLLDDEELDGVACAVLELRFESEGELEEPERGFGPPGERRGRLPEPSRAAPAAFETTYEAKIEGRLWFALEARHPLRLELEGELSIERSMVQERGERSVSMHMLQTGTFERVVKVSAQNTEEAK